MSNIKDITRFNIVVEHEVDSAIQSQYLDYIFFDLIIEREISRLNKQYVNADRIRKELENMGISLKDEKEYLFVYRNNKWNYLEYFIKRIPLEVNFFGLDYIYNPKNNLLL